MFFYIIDNIFFTLIYLINYFDSYRYQHWIISRIFSFWSVIWVQLNLINPDSYLITCKRVVWAVD